MTLGNWIRPPIKFPMVYIPEMVVGAKVWGNEEEKDGSGLTEEGKTFYLTIVNMLHSSIKLLGKDEQIPVVFSEMFPGLELQPGERETQLVNFIGEDEKHTQDWGNLTRVDYDYDQAVDPGRTIDDGIPVEAYNELLDGEYKDYDKKWREVRDYLSTECTFWDAVQGGGPAGSAECYAFLLGLLQVKRNWIYGMRTIGLNPFDPNGDNNIAAFFNFKADPEYESQNWQVNGSGLLNISVLNNYISLWQPRDWQDKEGTSYHFDGIAQRFNKIIKSLTDNETIVGQAKDYDEESARSIWTELKDNFSGLEFSVDLKESILESFYRLSTKQYSYVCGIMGLNNSIININRYNKRDYSQRKDDQIYEMKEEQRAAQKNNSAHRKEEKQLMHRLEQRSKERHRTEERAQNNKVSKKK